MIFSRIFNLEKFVYEIHDIILMLFKWNNYSNYPLLLNQQPPTKYDQFWPTISNIR